MRKKIKYFMAFALLTISCFLINPGFSYSSHPNNTPDNDTTNIGIAQFTVVGLDSVSVGWVQDRLDTVTGITFNFACWADTIIFIEYDSLKINQDRLLNVIRQLGYNPKVREY